MFYLYFCIDCASLLLLSVTSPNGPESSPILPQPIVEAASEEQKPIRMSAKRKLVFTVEETPTTPKRNLKIPKEEDGTPIIIAPKRRSSRVRRYAVV